MDFSVFTTSELEAITKGEFDKLPTAKLKYYVAQEAAQGKRGGAEDSMLDMDAFTRSAERAATGTPRALSKVGSWISEKLGGSPTDIDLYNKAYGLTTDAEREGEARVAFEESPIASFAGAVAGSALDPVNLMSGAGIASKVVSSAAPVVRAGVAGAVSGAVGGAVAPTYEEYGDSIVKNAIFGGLAGGTMGTVMGMLGKYLKPGMSKGLVDAEEAQAQATKDAYRQSQLQKQFAVGEETAMNPAYTREIAEQSLPPPVRGAVDNPALFESPPAKPLGEQTELDFNRQPEQLEFAFDVRGTKTNDPYQGDLLSIAAKTGTEEPVKMTAAYKELAEKYKEDPALLGRKAHLLTRAAKDLQEVGIEKLPETWEEGVDAAVALWKSGRWGDC